MTSPRNVADIDGFSRASAHLTLFFNDTVLGYGTGLLAKTPKGISLITALHNFTGRNEKGQSVSDLAGWPNRVYIQGYDYDATCLLFQGANDPNQYGAIPIFWRHPAGPQIDIAILPINIGTSASRLDESFLNANYGATVKLYVSQLCHIIGYPEGLFQTIGPNRVLPIWKTGHIASEPSIYENGLPKILIDAATRKGMSGSPVFVRGVVRSLGSSTPNRLLGIYTGRTSEMSDVGIVFTPEAILKVIETGHINQPLHYPAE